jgi:hypothetical protein
MRRLARALADDPTILYRHAPNRAALLEGAAETVLAPAHRRPGWTARLPTVARGYRWLALAYPKVVPLLVTRPLATPLAFHPKGILRPFENVLALLTAAGFCDRRSSLAAVGTHGGTAAPEVPGPPCCSYVTSAVSWPSWPGPP